jgi:REP element-mobilizing transposase RayT
MDGMSIRNQQKRATYAAYRLCHAIERMLRAETGSDKMKANRWANAWSTAYFARTNRGSASNADIYAEQFERRRQVRFFAEQSQVD